MANLFVSAATREFEALRAHIRQDLDFPSVRVEVQETFRPFGRQCLVELNAYVKSCDAMIHVVGQHLGEIPGSEEVDAVLEELDGFVEKTKMTEAAVRQLTYTQWEAWLAIYHGKRLYIAVPEGCEAANVAHLDALRAVDRFPITPFSSPDRLSVTLLQALHDLLPPTTVPVKAPPSLGPRFKGRAEKLAEIRKNFRDAASSSRVDAPTIAITGLGGIGKTRLAIEFAHLFAKDYTALLALSASSPDELRSSFADLAETLGLPERYDPSLENRFNAVRRWLNDQSNRGWLLLVDNVDTKDAQENVIELQKTLHRGQMLVTGRLQQWPERFQTVSLGKLDRRHAIDYLLEATETMRVAEGKDSDHKKADQLADTLGDLALGLVQAAAAIRHRRISFSTYLEDWETKRSMLLDDPDFDPKIVDYPSTVAVTWLTSYEQLPAASKYLLNLLCWFAPDPIPERTLNKALWTAESLHAAPGEAREALAGDNVAKALLPLYDYSLAEPLLADLTESSLSVHRLVQEVGRDRQQRAGVDEALRAAAMHLLAADFVRPDTIENTTLQILPELRALAPHVYRSLADGVPPSVQGVASTLRRVLSDMHRAEGQWTMALQEAEQAVSEARGALEGACGSNSVAVTKVLVRSLTTWSDALMACGQVENARAPAEEALAKVCLQAEDQVRDKDGAWLRMLANHILGNVHQHRGELKDALERFEAAREIAQGLCDVEPENHAHRRALGIALENVGRVYEDRGELQRGLEHFEASRVIRQGLCDGEPENHAHRRELGVALSYVGRVYETRGELQRALEHFEASREIVQELCDGEPENHAHRRDLGVTLGNVGRVYEKRGELQRALEHFEASREIVQELCDGEPENHAHRRDLGVTLGNVGRVYEKRGELQRALEHFEASREIVQELCDGEPENHAHRRELGVALGNEGRVCEERGEFSEALEHFEASREIAQGLCDREPENHAHRRDLGIALQNAGRVYKRSGDVKRALQCFKTTRRTFRDLYHRDGRSVATKRELAIACIMVANVLPKTKRKEAIQTLNEARDLLQELEREGAAFGDIQSLLQQVMELRRKMR